MRIAAPFSAIRTGYEVWVGERRYWANCAWDILGIPAALQCDAQMVATLPDNREQARLEIKRGQVQHQGEVVRFPNPVKRWYDDLIDT